MSNPSRILYAPQGTGKSAAAKRIAIQYGLRIVDEWHESRAHQATGHLYVTNVKPVNPPLRMIELRS